MWPSIKRYIRWLWEHHSVLRWFVHHTLFFIHWCIIDSSYHCCMVVTFLYSVALWAIQMVGWQLLFLPQPKAQQDMRSHISSFTQLIGCSIYIWMCSYIRWRVRWHSLYLSYIRSAPLQFGGTTLTLLLKPPPLVCKYIHVVKAPPQSYRWVVFS